MYFNRAQSQKIMLQPCLIAADLLNTGPISNIPGPDLKILKKLACKCGLILDFSNQGNH